MRFTGVLVFILLVLLGFSAISAQQIVPIMDVIRYDSLATLGGLAGTGTEYYASNDYYIAVRFTADSFAFVLGAVQYRLSVINLPSPIPKIYVAHEVSGRPGPILDSVLNVQVASSFKTGYVSRLDGDLFHKGESFWVLLGPIQGGDDPAWTAVYDLKTPDYGRSFISTDGGITWDSLGGLGLADGDGDWGIRVAGEYGRENKLLINEVLYRPDTRSTDFERNHQWVELYNPGPEQDSSVVRFFLIDRAKEDTVALPPFIFSAKSYMVVHFSDSSATNDLDLDSDGVGHIFLPRDPLTLDERKDGVALFVWNKYSSLPPVHPHKIKDYISWDGNSLSRDFHSGVPFGVELPCPTLIMSCQSADSDYVKRLPPTPNGREVGPLLYLTPGMSIGRDAFSMDMDGRAAVDFSFHGGRNAVGPTMGRKNETPSMQAELAGSDPSPQAQKDWTVMMYVAADAGGETGEVPERYYYDQLNQLESSLPPGGLANVNLALFYDGGRIVVPGYSDGTTLRGAPQFDTTSALANLRVVPETEANTGDSSTLRNFLSWAMATFPASHYVLALKGDGAGWQGLLTDSGGGNVDWLQLAELKSGLASGLAETKLDLLVLDAPLMGQLEVAAQVNSFARLMVASPEMIEPAAIDYAGLVDTLEKNPGIAPLDLTGFLIDSLIFHREASNPLAVWAAVDLDNLSPLLTQVDILAGNLKNGLEDVCAKGDSTDNFQLKVREALKKSLHFGKQYHGMGDYVDLKDFSQKLLDLTLSPCGNHRDRASQIRSILNDAGVVPAKFAGIRDSASGGLSIYFPSSREKNPSLVAARKDSLYQDTLYDFSYDNPGITGIIPPDTFIYAADMSACYPHPGYDTCGSYAPPLNHPHPPAPDLDFRDSTRWDEFLIRYYKPVADAGDATVINAFASQPVGFNGRGSSDADSDSLLYFWDVDPTADNPFDCDSVFREDLDKDCVDGNADDQDLKGGTPTFSSGYPVPGQYTVILNVWDSHDDSLADPLRSFQTDSSKVTFTVNAGQVFLVDEDVDSVPFGFYTTRLNQAGFPLVHRLLNASDCSHRKAISPGSKEPAEGPIFWQTGREGDCLFPREAIRALANWMDDSLGTGYSYGAWVFTPKLGKDTAYQNSSGSVDDFFRSYFSLDTAKTTMQVSNWLRPADTSFGSIPVFDGLGALLDRLYLRISPDSLFDSLSSLKITSTRKDHYPLLVDSSGRVMAIATIRNLGGGRKQGNIVSSFGLEHLRLDNSSDSLKMDTLLARLGAWLSSPSERVLGRQKGDLDSNGNFTPSDVVLMLNCVYLDNSKQECNPMYADLNCRDGLTPADVVLELNLVFLGKDPSPCF